ncbi:MAG: prolipoprotein diacylglyceryl transferase [Anaerolineales bacterium]|nr:prolipoprotein diacylglyceryl transferase [Anaerolineales bacterium]
MYPILFTLGGVPVYAYGTFFFFALLIGAMLLVYESRRRHWPREEVIPITLAAFVGGMIGARISIFFFNGMETASQTLNFFALFDPRIGPGSIMGAVAGAYLGGYIASKAIGKAGCACDAFAPAMALAMGIGRIGAFLAGVDGLGKPTTVPWGVTLPGVGFAVHPTPLYDAGFNFIWFAVLMLLRDHPKMQNGNLLKFGLAGYAVVRFFIEFVRTNRILALGLTGQQFACLFLLAALGVYYFRQWKNQNRLMPV